MRRIEMTFRNPNQLPTNRASCDRELATVLDTENSAFTGWMKVSEFPTVLRTQRSLTLAASVANQVLHHCREVFYRVVEHASLEFGEAPVLAREEL
jgi:hypothetical protein